MYSFLLALHSLVRWLVLISFLFALYRSYRGLITHQSFAHADNLARTLLTITAHIQLIIGLCLYLISPIVNYFLHNFPTAVHERHIRFFGMEHITMMVIAITLVTIGSVKAKRQPDGRRKFKTMAVWFTIAFLIVFISIPWSFSPFTSRPSFRPF